MYFLENFLVNLPFALIGFFAVVIGFGRRDGWIGTIFTILGAILILGLVVEWAQTGAREDTIWTTALSATGFAAGFVWLLTRRRRASPTPTTD